MKQKIFSRLLIIICALCFTSNEAYSQAGKWSFKRNSSSTSSTSTQTRQATTASTSGSSNVAYLDILKKYAPFYYKRKIISSEKTKDTSYSKNYRYFDSAGFEINVSLMNCYRCAGLGKNLLNGQSCMMCGGDGWIRCLVMAWNEKNKVGLDVDGNPIVVGAGGSTTHSSGSNNSGSSSGGSSGSGSIYTTCRICNGSGVCTSCNGRGTSLYTYGGSDRTACSSCHGNKRCFNCHGTGRQ